MVAKGNEVQIEIRKVPFDKGDFLPMPGKVLFRPFDFVGKNKKMGISREPGHRARIVDPFSPLQIHRGMANGEKMVGDKGPDVDGYGFLPKEMPVFRLDFVDDFGSRRKEVKDEFAVPGKVFFAYAMAVDPEIHRRKIGDRRVDVGIGESVVAVKMEFGPFGEGIDFDSVENAPVTVDNTGVP